MSKKFFRETRWIKFCKICGTEYRPLKYSWEADTGLCNKCRHKWYKELYKKKIAYFNQPERKKQRYEVWLKWIKKNYERRRMLALISYHKRKNDPKNKTRRHRATKKPDK
jgi:hypothetical protein